MLRTYLATKLKKRYFLAATVDGTVPSCGEGALFCFFFHPKFFVQDGGKVLFNMSWD